ncbi:MAG: DUF4838 domain-containing protein [Bacteroidota bacterium]
MMAACTGTAQQITLTTDQGTEYTIVVPADASNLEQRSATVLQSYIRRISGAQLPIVTETKNMKGPAIFIGNTGMAEELGKMRPESYLIRSVGNDLIIRGGSGRGLIYGVYTFLEKYLYCKKLTGQPASVPPIKTIILERYINYENQPQYIYREVYYPAPFDAEYLEWHKLQRFEDLWGLWGHSYNKLVPAKTYFKPHPEYYAYVKGKRQPTQLCLSNEEVFKIVVADFKKRIADNPDAVYWSISPNDDIGYCECDKCKPFDDQQGGPSGSLIRFVNRVAAVFPEIKFTTLAYGFTHRAPKTLKPAENVYIFLSTIDAFRDKPLTEEGSAATFRNDLKGWKALTSNLFVWDYVTQFTNYLAPFPNFHTLQANIQYLHSNGVKGMFVQGSGETYSEWAELRCYIISKLLEDDKADVNRLTSEFMANYYGAAAPYLQQYISLLQEKMLASKRKLDIYGNPVNEWNSYLTPELLDQYSALFDKADAAAGIDVSTALRVKKARLPLEYTVLQQARFYGIEKHGIFVRNKDNDWVVKPNFEQKIARFIEQCKAAKVTELSEGGLTPDAYKAEWDEILKKGVQPTNALDANVTLQYPFAPEYPAKGVRTLTDGNPGYKDFSYNWLCFYGVPLVATVDLGRVRTVQTIRTRFLDDPRHWIFLPANIKVEVSVDGTSYTTVSNVKSGNIEEHYENAIKEFKATVKPVDARYIRVTAENLKELPEWRYREHKKPMMACDEIYVQ